MIKVRAVTAADIATIRDLAATIWHEYYPAVIGRGQIDYMLETMYAAETILREMAAGVTWELVVDGGEPIGFLSYIHETPTATVTLNKLYLSPESHGKGIGRRLLERVKTAAVSLRAQTISLRVNKRNARAIRAYERSGFQIAESVVSDIGSGFVMDDFVMTIDLTGPGRR